MKSKQLQYLTGTALLICVAVVSAFFSPEVQTSLKGKGEANSAVTKTPADDTVNDIANAEANKPADDTANVSAYKSADDTATAQTYAAVDKPESEPSPENADTPIFSRELAKDLVPDGDDPSSRLMEIEASLYRRGDADVSLEERRILRAKRVVLKGKLALSPQFGDPRRGDAAQFYCNALADELDLQGLEEFETQLNETSWEAHSGAKPNTFAYKTYVRIVQAASKKDKEALEALTADLETIAQNGAIDAAVAGKVWKFIDPIDRVDHELGNRAKAKMLAGFQKSGSTVQYPELQESYRAPNLTLPEGDPLKFDPAALDPPLGETREFYTVLIGKLKETSAQIPENTERDDYRAIKARIVQALGTSNAAALVVPSAFESSPGSEQWTAAPQYLAEIAALADEAHLSLFAYDDAFVAREIAQKFLFKVQVERAIAQNDTESFDRLVQEALTYIETTSDDPGVIYRIDSLVGAAKDKIPADRLARFKKDFQERLAGSSYPNIRRIRHLAALAD